VRPTGGGVMRAAPREWWNTEGWHTRFTMCQLNPDKPFGLGSTGDNYCWIFLTRESLDKYLRSQPFAPVPEGIGMHFSPYLRVMLAVANKLKISPDNQPKKSEIVAELSSAWTGPGPLSKNLLNSAATLLREPESQLGRARKT
jgi:hypothetical protein